MLDDVDAVPWRTFRHAFGEASDVPRMLRALRERTERQTALRELFACLLHQGTLNEATPHAVPFLFELLADAATPERNWIAFLIATIADGRGYLSTHLHVDEARWRAVLAERGTTIEAELAREARLVAQVQAQVDRNVQLLVPHLADGQSEIRAAIARALSHQTTRAAELLPALEAAEAAETTTDARDALRMSLARLRAVPAR